MSISYLGFDGRTHRGTLVVAASVAKSVVRVFGSLRESGYPIRRMQPSAAYGGSDEKSMLADNTSAFNCRPITGGGGWSKHAYGKAIDVNPFENPYIKGNLVDPESARKYADRDQRVRGMIHAADAVVNAFAARGWSWGGSWTSPTDYQHFER